MESPSQMRIRVDGQGRMVLPRGVRDEIVRVPGEVLLRRTADGLLLSAADEAGAVGQAPDGLPVLSLGRPVRNSEVLDAIDREREGR
jgi:DNA-binding transcriptional regulator/RsmH inhibitor MraZ